MKKAQRPRSKTANRPAARRAPRRPATRPAAGSPAAPPAAPVVEIAPAPAPVVASPPAPDPIVLAEPEFVFAARTGEAEPPRPLPVARRGVFFDVENSSRPDHVAYVLDHLALDWTDRRTELVAVGNWRVVSVETARLLARRGAQLVHSAPSTGVRDWSDLRIAVAAGAWLASARPGDSIEVVSDDQAFDAIGDVAATLGLVYRRLSFRALSGRAPGPAIESAAAGPRGGARGYRARRGRYGRRGPGVVAGPRPVPGHHVPAVADRPHPAPRPVEKAAPDADAAPHPAPAEDIRKTVEDLLASSPRGVTLDEVSNALKAHGFRRPPGSPRLVTRLRHLRGIEVSRSGLVRLIGPPPPPDEVQPAPPSDESPGAEAGPGEPVASSQAPDSGPRRRRRRRGGRGRRRPAAGPAVPVSHGPAAPGA
jgi:hypothetical protein